MSWKKLGCVFNCQQISNWQNSHAYVPTTLTLPDRIRVYIAFRDAENIGRIGFVDIDLDNPMRVLGVSENPCLDIGPLGAFDDSGMTPLSVIKNEDEIWLYYAGWHLSQTVRYHLFTGLAISLDGGINFKRHSNVPVLDRTEQAWLVRSGVCVLKDGETWKCWGATGSEMIEIDGKKIPTYDWSYIESKDGISWPPHHKVAIFKDIDHGITGYGRSHVFKENNIYKAWIPVRTYKGYQSIGYSESSDGLNWSELEYKNGLFPSVDGFDSKEVCFPNVFDVGARRYMVYNGNDFGKTGFGLALWQD